MLCDVDCTFAGGIFPSHSAVDQESGPLKNVVDTSSQRPLKRVTHCRLMPE